MNSALERLLSLRVEDMMNREVATVRIERSIHDAAQDLARARVSGAPVLDAAGRCVGMLTATDFLHREAGTHDHLHRSATPPPGLAGDENIAAWMATDVQSITPNATLLAAARQMCDMHVHRLVVLDEEGRPVGMLSTLDLISSLVLAFEE